MKKNKGLVSIIVNCRNGEKFIYRSINSILEQTYKNFEVIFFDNNSKDKTKKEINKFKDKRIKYFKSKKNLKLYDARNKAIEKSKGEFITFLDIDDEWIKDKLNIQFNRLKKSKNDICFSNYWISTNSKIKKFKDELKISNVTHQIINDYPIGILTVMLKSEIFTKHKFSFNNNYEIIGDYDFFFRLSKKFKFECINKPLAIYHIHKNNLSIKKINLEIIEINNWYNLNKDFLNKRKNNILYLNNIRKCNYLFSLRKLNFFSKEFSDINFSKIKIKLYLKIFLQKLKLL